MLKIRLQRIGRTNDPYFKLIVTPSTYKAKTHKFIEDLGSFNIQEGKAKLKKDRVNHWIKMGAQITPTAHNLLVSEKIIEGKKKNVLPKKSPTQKRKEMKKK